MVIYFNIGPVCKYLFLCWAKLLFFPNNLGLNFIFSPIPTLSLSVVPLFMPMKMKTNLESWDDSHRMKMKTNLEFLLLLNPSHMPHHFSHSFSPIINSYHFHLSSASFRPNYLVYRQIGLTNQSNKMTKKKSFVNHGSFLA